MKIQSCLALRAKSRGIKSLAGMILPLILLFTVLSVGILVVTDGKAFADTPDPDTDPTVDRIRVYRNLLETGDVFIIFLADIPYATWPDTPVTETFIWQLIDTDGTTVLGSTTGYAYNNDGFNYNVYSMYFDAADALVWETAYTIRLSGNPAVFLAPPSYNFTIAASDYTNLVTSSDNQAALAVEVLYLANDLNTKWGLETDYRLTLETETGTVLSIYGEDVFRGAAYGIQGLAPAAFRFVISNITATDRSWNTTYVTDLEDQWLGTWIEGARNGSRDLLGTSYDLTSIFLLLAMCAALVIANLSLTSDAWNGLLDVAFVMCIGARLGVYSLVYLGLVEALCIIYIAMALWRRIPA